MEVVLLTCLISESCSKGYVTINTSFCFNETFSMLTEHSKYNPRHRDVRPLLDRASELEQELTDSYFTRGRLVIETPELLAKSDSLRKSIKVARRENFRAQKKLIFTNIDNITLKVVNK